MILQVLGSCMSILISKAKLFLVRLVLLNVVTQTHSLARNIQMDNPGAQTLAGVTAEAVAEQQNSVTRKKKQNVSQVNKMEEADNKKLGLVRS